MRIITWNVNGLRSVGRKGLLAWLEAEKPDILCMQETKAHPQQLPPELEDPDGYDAFFHSARKKGYSGGVATWIRNDSPVDAQSRACCQGWASTASTKRAACSSPSSRPSRLLNCYFPNSQRGLERLGYKLDFYDTFLHYCNRLRRQGRRG